MTKQTRKIGLGIMGFADLLIALNILQLRRCASDGGNADGFFSTRAHRASAGLAAERGVFSAYRGSRLQALHQRHRNATVTTIANPEHQPHRRLLARHRTHMACRKSAASWTASCSLRFIQPSFVAHAPSVSISPHSSLS